MDGQSFKEVVIIIQHPVLFIVTTFKLFLHKRDELTMKLHVVFTVLRKDMLLYQLKQFLDSNNVGYSCKQFQ